ncbi:MAG: hypothetical protein IKM64_00840 [Clostridia bacterium]|nr:hypothetical protein [Clostridia bacterium]
MKIKIAVIAGALFLPLLLMAINARSNKSKEKRYEQVQLPFTALAFVVVCCVLMGKLNEWAQLLLAQNFMQPVMNWVNGFPDWLFGANLLGIYVVNIGIIVAYLLLKNSSRGVFWLARAVVHFLMKLLKIKREDEKMGDLPDNYEDLTGMKKLYWRFQNIFYDIEGATGTIREKWLMAGEILLYAANILGCVYLLALAFAMMPVLNLFNIGQWYPFGFVNQLLDKLYLWPTITLLLVKEIGYYLNGQPREFVKDTEQVLIPEEETAEPVDYTEMKDRFAAQFPERFLNAMKAPNFPAVESAAQTTDPLALAVRERLLKDNKDRKVSNVVLECITNLPSRENVVIDTVLSAEFGDCLMLYMNLLLGKGENLLVLCENEDECNRVRDFIRDKLKRINVFAPVWTVSSVEEAGATADSDVLVLTPQKVLDQRIQMAQERFFRHATTVLVTDSSRLICEMANLMTIVANFMCHGKQTPIQYICLCNSIPGEMRSTLEQVLAPGRPFKSYQCFKSNETNHILVWNYEGTQNPKNPLAQQNLFGQAMDKVYLGALMPIAFVAARHQVPEISIMANRLPYRELSDALGDSFNRINHFFPREASASDLLRKFAFNRIDAENPFIVVLDETYNLPMTLRNFCRRIGRETSMVNIVSKPYMLRDYFSAHASAYLNDHHYAEMFAPILSDTWRVTLLKLMDDMVSREGLSENRLMECIRDMEPEVKDVHQALQVFVRRLLGSEETVKTDALFKVGHTNVFNADEGEFVRSRVIRMTDRRLYEQLVGDIRPAVVDMEGKRLSLGIGCKDIFRYYLPGQAIVADGYMHIIEKIDAQEGVIYTGRKVNSLNEPVDYFQHRLYTADLRACKEEGTKVDLRGAGAGKAVVDEYVAVLHRNVPISTTTWGFFVPPIGQEKLDLTNYSRYRRLSEENKQKAQREKKNASVLSLRFSGMDPAHADRVAFTMAVLLSEIMKTYFPYTWPCLAVCPVLHSYDFLQDGCMNRNLSSLYPQVQVPGECQPAEGDVEILFIEDSESDTGMLEALMRNQTVPFSATFSLLLDFLRWKEEFTPEKNIAGDYLHFGGEGVPDVLELGIVRQIMEQLESTRPSGIHWPEQDAGANSCYFCHKGLYQQDYVTIMGADGKKDRTVCADCAKRLISRKEELIPLYRQTREWLHKTYGVQLPRKLKVKFVSASTISKQYKKNLAKGRIIGLAQSLTKTAWVETNSPKEHILSTLVHELTHFWQYDHIHTHDKVAIEGHTSYMEVQYMRALGYERHARYLDSNLRSRTDDNYGKGYVWLTAMMQSRPDNDPFAYMLEEFDRKKPRKEKITDFIPEIPPVEELPPPPAGGDVPPPVVGGDVPPPVVGGDVPPHVVGGDVPPPVVGGDVPPPVGVPVGGIISTTEVELGEDDVGDVKTKKE